MWCHGDVMQSNAIYGVFSALILDVYIMSQLNIFEIIKNWNQWAGLYYCFVIYFCSIVGDDECCGMERIWIRWLLQSRTSQIDRGCEVGMCVTKRDFSSTCWWLPIFAYVPCGRSVSFHQFVATSCADKISMASSRIFQCQVCPWWMCAVWCALQNDMNCTRCRNFRETYRWNKETAIFGEIKGLKSDYPAFFVLFVVCCVVCCVLCVVCVVCFILLNRSILSNLVASNRKPPHKPNQIQHVWLCSCSLIWPRQRR